MNMFVLVILMSASTVGAVSDPMSEKECDIMMNTLKKSVKGVQSMECITEKKFKEKYQSSNEHKEMGV